MVIGAGRIEKIPDEFANPAKFDVRKAGGQDPESVSPLAGSAALGVINLAGLGQVDTRSLYPYAPETVPVVAFAAPPSSQQPAGAAGGSDAAGSTKTTTGSGKTYADKAALLNAIVRNSGVAGAAGLTLDDIKDRDLEDANGKKLSLETIAQKIIERRMKEEEKPADGVKPPAEPPADTSTPAK